MAHHGMGMFRHELDLEGCAFGQVSRERLNHVAAALQSVDAKLSYVLAAVGLQLFGFLLAVVLYFLAHVPLAR
ncbi:MAG TPA: hypothetical protein VNL71_00285 [Chloroflexota bacterium]|nr:hypothetical protein [Chloroflexota bacterium]